MYPKSRPNPDVFRGLCTAAEQPGDAVYVSGPRVGSYYPVRRADCQDPDKMPAAGLVLRKLSATECWVQVGGDVRGVFTGLEQNKTYKVGVNGTIQRTAPTPGGAHGLAYVQFLGLALDEDVLRVLQHQGDMKIRTT